MDNDSSCDNVISNMKIIDDSINVFMQQTMFAKYVLKCSNINVNDEVEMENKKHSLITEVWRQAQYHHRNTNHLNGSSTLKDKKEGTNIMNNVLAVILQLFQTKMLIIDDLLVLCWQYCSNYDSNNVNNNDNDDNNIIKNESPNDNENSTNLCSFPNIMLILY